MLLEPKCFLWSLSIESSSFGLSQLKAKPLTIAAMAPNKPLEQPRVPSSLLVCCAQSTLVQIPTSDPATCPGTEQGTALLPLTTARGLQMGWTLPGWGRCWWHKWHAVPLAGWWEHRGSKHGLMGNGPKRHREWNTTGAKPTLWAQHCWNNTVVNYKGL